MDFHDLKDDRDTTKVLDYSLSLYPSSSYPKSPRPVSPLPFLSSADAYYYGPPSLLRKPDEAHLRSASSADIYLYGWLPPEPPWMDKAVSVIEMERWSTDDSDHEGHQLRRPGVRGSKRVSPCQENWGFGVRLATFHKVRIEKPEETVAARRPIRGLLQQLQITGSNIIRRAIGWCSC